MLHPKTYLNKVLVAGRRSLQLWNIRSGSLTLRHENHRLEAAIHRLESEPMNIPRPLIPTIDVIALIHELGHIFGARVLR